jgi:hypothetical protein
MNWCDAVAVALRLQLSYGTSSTVGRDFAELSMLVVVVDSLEYGDLWSRAGFGRQSMHAVLPTRSVVGMATPRGLLFWVLTAIAFTLPLEGVSTGYLGEGVRTIPFYLAALALPLALLRWSVLVKGMANSRGFLPIVLAFAWAALLYYLHPLREHKEVQLVAQLIALGAMFTMVAQDTRARRILIWAYWMGSVILSVMSLVDYTRGRYTVWSHGGVVRAEDLVGLKTNTHAFEVGAGLVVAFVLLGRVTTGRTRLALALSIVVGAVAFMTDASKGASVAFVLSMLLWALLCFPSGGRTGAHPLFKRVVYLAVFVGCLSFAASRFDLVKRLVGYSAGRFHDMLYEHKYSERDVLFREGLKLVEGHLVGAGQGNSMALLDGEDVHNYYLRMLIDGGVLGFCLFSVGLFLVLRTGWKWSRSSGEFEVLLALVFLLIGSVTLAAFHYKIMWFFLALNCRTPAPLPSSSLSVCHSREERL